MVIECTSGRLLDVVPVSVEPEVCRRLGLPDVLGVWASQCAISEVDRVEALAVQTVEYLEGFPCCAATERLSGLDVLAAEILCR